VQDNGQNRSPLPRFLAGPPDANPGGSGPGGDALLQARGALRDFLETNLKKSPDRADVVSGDPAAEILRYSGTHGIDIIIVWGKVSDNGRVLHSQAARRVIKQSAAHVWTFSADGGPLKELRLPDDPKR